MIRRNIVSALGVCTALAAGIALGGGPLSSHDDVTTTPAAVHADPALKSAAAFGQKWAAQVGPDLYAGRLRGRRVALVSLPGVPAATLQQLSDGLSVAKGTVSARASLTRTLLDPDHKVAVDTLGGQFAGQSDGAVNPKLSTYQRMGQIIGTAVSAAQDSSARPASSEVTTAQETLRTAKLASVTGGRAPASLALVVVGRGGDPQIVGDILRGLASRFTGIVVAGDEASAEHGVLAGLRRQKWKTTVMTVDGVDTAYGRTAAEAGLVAQLTRRGGSYGASGIDGLVPLG